MTQRTPMSKLGIAAVCILAVVFGLTGCGGKTNDRDQRDRAIEFTELEPTPSSCDVRPIGATVFGTTLIQYTTFDAPSSFLDIVPEFSTNGGVTFFPATQGNGGDGDILLEASPGGSNHIFAWDSLVDLPGSVNGPVGNIVFRVTPSRTPARRPSARCSGRPASRRCSRSRTSPRSSISVRWRVAWRRTVCPSASS